MCESDDIDQKFTTQAADFNLDGEYERRSQSDNSTSVLKTESQSTNQDYSDELSLIEKKASERAKKNAKKSAKKSANSEASNTEIAKIDQYGNKEQPCKPKNVYFGNVLKVGFGVELPQDIDQDIDLTYKDDIARKVIMLMYNKNPDENVTKEDFAILLKTNRFVIKKRNEKKQRKDEPEKKYFSKSTWHIYNRFKVSPTISKKDAKISRKDAHAKMKAYYMLKDVIFNRLWGPNKKLGLHNDVVRELLTDDRLIEDFLSQEALEQVLEAMHEQLVEDIKKCAERFNENPHYFLAYHKGTDQVIIKRINKKPVKRGGKQLIKIPWTYQDNIQAVIAFLKKLHFRAGIEQLPEMTIMLQNRIDHFSQKLPLN